MNVYPNDDADTAAKKIANDSPKRKKNNKKEKDDQKQLPVFPTYKYSRPFLHEAVILGGLPYFISYAPRFDKILAFETIDEAPSRTLRPPNREEYPYTPYEFASADELEEYLKRAKAETIDSLYQKGKAIIKKYNDQDEPKLRLLATDLVWSYFQDKFGTTHYLGIFGDNDSGKSSVGNTFEAVGYRTVNMTSPTAPNIFRMLGMIESGQSVLILDEADKIDNDTDIMNILKSGYDYKKKVPKINNNTLKQEWYYAYGLKIIIAEKSPSKFKAKGLLDRILPFTVYPGESELDIKEVTAAHERDSQLDQALGELLDFRKLMLVYRLLHFEDSIVDLDVGVIRRNRELCKPYIRLFYGTKVQNEIEETFQTFLDSKNSKKATSIEAILIPVIINLVERRGNKVASSEIWDFIKEELEGEPYGLDEYHISDYTLYRTTITKMLEDKFGADAKHTNRGSITIFNLDKLQKIQRSYDTDIIIKTRLKNVIENDGDRSDSCDSSRGGLGGSDDPKTIEELDNGNGKDEDISRNGGSEGYPVPPLPTQAPSQPSLPSPSVLEDSSTLKEYERVHKKSLEHSKAAVRGWNNP